MSFNILDEFSKQSERYEEPNQVLRLNAWKKT